MKKKQTNFWKNWKICVIIILAFAVFLLYLNYDDNQLYEKCIDECVLENYDCLDSAEIFVFKPETYQYIYSGVSEWCGDELASCVRWCKI